MKKMFQKQTSRLKSGWALLFGKKTLEELPISLTQDKLLRKAALSLVGGLIWCGGKTNEILLTEFKHMLSGHFSALEIDAVLENLENQKIDAEALAEQLKDIPVESQERILKGMLRLAYSDNYTTQEHEYISKAAAIFGFDKEAVDEMADVIHEENQQKKKLIKSGAGLIAALVVLLVFILTATWLISLLFGLILAYIFLPMEKWYERHLSKGGYLYFISRILGNVSSSIGKITSKPDLTNTEIEIKTRNQLTSRATTATLLTVVFMGLAVLVILTGISMKYVSGGLRSAYDASSGHISKVNTAYQMYKDDLSQIPEAMPFNEEIKDYLNRLEAQKSRFENLPLIRDAIEWGTQVLKDEKTQKEIISYVLKRTGGMVSMTAGILYNFVMFLVNLLLTFFFFSLILRKMADSVNSQGNTAEQQGNYIVKVIINSDWMPHAGKDSLEEAQTIVNEVINRLKLWLRGYLTLVLIDSTVYSTMFIILGVPYAIILGIIAGMGVLLPYIGPVFSTCLTVLVCLVVGDASMLQIIAVICTYLIYNGVVEQFFLYPSVIGDRLGLTTLETIIVVLLGALFAGIPGMIFALPATSVLKYLIQQVYRCWKTDPQT